MYRWIGSNYMMISKTKYIEDLMLIDSFLSIKLRDEGGGGGGIHHKHYEALFVLSFFIRPPRGSLL